MTNDSLHEYLNILNLTRDYLTEGWEKRYDDVIPSSQDCVSEPWEEKKEEKAELSSIADEVSVCTRCRLAGSRTYAVPGEGTAEPKVMVIGEAPGAMEDESGRPFVGKAGKYLDKWLEAIGLSRERDVFIGNIIKCRPPNNRDPFLDEQEACLPFLQRQMDILKPFAILAVGRIATHILTGSEESMGRLHGRTLSYRGTPLIPTYHPSGVLRNPQYRKPVWEDLKKLKRLIDGGE
ncbi:MAG: uracil-DNA glycosylase [Spirochaetia bacterium]